ncbi:Ig-like domain-containing protein [uncultured Parabacteroides sp.]|jgi:uncharacterized protein YjdB|uniref:Ig-like domain-containing protein n=1 Tax=uncultured Parabacteroides sp. TaxID=512312 RepID=UPI0025F7076F|nr:Ig-like domain-containing protein [uncultured Parabacteroides sp.]
MKKEFLAIIMLAMLFACKNEEKTKVTAIQLDKTELTLKIGEEYTFKVNQIPENASTPTYIWRADKLSSSPYDGEVVFVSQDGHITAIYEGETVLTVEAFYPDESSDIKATCKIIVKPVNAESIKLNKNNITLDIHESEGLYYTITPENTTHKEVEWKSDNPKVVNVDNTGFIQPLSSGSANIIVKIKNTEISDTCNIIVNPIKVEAIGLNHSALDIQVGDSVLLIASFLPDNATNKNITWSSSNENIAIVNQKGKVITNTPGECYIIATSEDGEHEAKCHLIVKDIPLSYIKLGDYSYYIEIGSEINIPISFYPENATNKKVTWTSSNPNSVFIDQNGNAKGIYLGSSQITVTADAGISTSCRVDVWDFWMFIDEFFPSSSLIINGANLSGTLYVGLKNNSTKTIDIKSMRIMDMNTYKDVDKITESSSFGLLRPGEHTSIKCTLNNVYDPMFIWVYDCDGKEHDKRFQYRGNN